MMLDISFEQSAKQRIHMKCQAFIFCKINECHLLQLLSAYAMKCEMHSSVSNLDLQSLRRHIYIKSIASLTSSSQVKCKCKTV